MGGAGLETTSEAAQIEMRTKPTSKMKLFTLTSRVTSDTGAGKIILPQPTLQAAFCCSQSVDNRPAVGGRLAVPAFPLAQTGVGQALPLHRPECAGWNSYATITFEFPVLLASQEVADDLG